MAAEVVDFFDYVDDYERRRRQREPRIEESPSAATATGGSSYALTALQREVDAVAGAAVGTRNDTLNAAAFSLGQLVAGGELDEHTVTEALTQAARDIGLADREIAPTIRSGLSTGRQMPRVAPPRPDPVTLAWKPPSSEHDVFWDARPELDHIRRFARARRASPWAVLGVVLARVAAATPPFVVLPPTIGGEASLNLFVGLVAPSGGGKGAAEACADDAVKIDGGLYETWKLGSGQGIAHGYVHREKGHLVRHADAVLFTISEIDYLGGLSEPRGSTLLPELRSTWMGERLGHLYVDPAKRVPVEPHTYRTALVAGIQPHRAAILLDDADAGTPQRFVWVPAIDPDAPDVAPDEPRPLRWDRPLSWPTAGFFGRSRLRVCAQAADTIEQARVARLRGHGDALDGHALLARLKVAAALTLLNGRVDVDDDDWALAAAVMAVSDATRGSVVAALAAKTREVNIARAEAEAERTVIVSERVEDAAVKRVGRTMLRALDRKGPLASAKLRREIAGRDRQHFETALTRLVDAGRVVEEETDRDSDGHGGSGVRFKIVWAAE